MVNVASLIIGIIALALIFIFPIGIIFFPLGILIVCYWCFALSWAFSACSQGNFKDDFQYLIPGWGAGKLTKNAYDEKCTI